MLSLPQNLESTVAQNTTGPVFLARMYHLMAYVCILMGDGQNCDLFLNTALQLAETHGNVLEMCWLSQNRVRANSQQAGVGVGGHGGGRWGVLTLPRSRELSTAVSRVWEASGAVLRGVTCP